MFAVTTPTDSQEEFARLAADPAYVETVLREGAEAANGIAEENMKTVRRLVGLSH